MANRNVSQLPENTDPQDTDWLLGASGNSPSVLQKIAVGNLPGSSAGGSIKFALPINENYVLTSSGYYFTDNTASDIEINCSNLGIGENIYWQNLSTKSVVFSGLNSIDSVSIPVNQGVKISSSNFIQFFLKDENKNIKKIEGNHLIDWIPGFAPFGFRFWRVDFNWILSEIQFYYEDAPSTKVALNSANIISFARSSTYSTGSLEYDDAVLNDGSYAGYTGRADGAGKQSYLIELPTEKVVSAVNLGGQNGGFYNRPTEVDLYRGNSLTDWTLIKTWTGSPLNIPVNSQDAKFDV